MRHAGYDLAGSHVDVAQLDDVPGDELLVAAPSEWVEATDAFGRGSAFVLYPSTDDGVLDEVAPVHFVGHHNGDSWGMNVTAVGDVTGDGFPDVAMRAIDGGVGYGFDGVTNVLFTGPYPPLDDRELTPGEVAARHLYDFDDDRSGVYAFVRCGDVNRDGKDDLCATATPNHFSSDPISAALVWFGPISDLIRYEDVDLRLQDRPGFGFRTAPTAADLDGDGVTELLVGVPENGTTGVYLVRDPGSGEVPLASFPFWEGDDPAGKAGHVLHAGCDVDGDGLQDFFVGAPMYDGRRGRAYVVTNDDGGPLAEVAHTTVTTDEPYDQLGWDGALADLNGDGACDLVVSVPRDIYFGLDRPGRVLVFLGPLPAGVVDASDADHVWIASEEADAFGESLATGDVDADGRDDRLVGAPDDDSRFDGGGSAVLILGASL